MASANVKNKRTESKVELLVGDVLNSRLLFRVGTAGKQFIGKNLGTEIVEADVDEARDQAIAGKLRQLCVPGR
jgi:hypothetical protein